MEPQQLQTEYTDIKSVTHRVEHSILSPTHAVDREKLLEELAWALKGGKIPAYLRTTPMKGGIRHVSSLCPQIRGTGKQYQL